MGTPWKKNLLQAMSREHKCDPPSLVQPPFGHECAVCNKTVDKDHPLHRAERPHRSEVQLVSPRQLTDRSTIWCLYRLESRPPNYGVDTFGERC